MMAEERIGHQSLAIQEDFVREGALSGRVRGHFTLTLLMAQCASHLTHLRPDYPVLTVAKSSGQGGVVPLTRFPTSVHSIGESVPSIPREPRLLLSERWVRDAFRPDHSRYTMGDL